MAGARERPPDARRVPGERRPAWRDRPAGGEPPTPSWTRTARRSRGRSSCGSPGRARAPSWSAAVSRSTELDADRDPAVAEVLETLTAARLLTSGDGFVEVAHEALLREWPRLQDWLDGGRRRSRGPAPPHRRRPRLGAATAVSRATSIAAPAWRPRSTGPASTRWSSTPPSAPSSTRAAGPRSARSSASGARTGGCGAARRRGGPARRGGRWRAASPPCRAARGGRGPQRAEQQRLAQQAADQAQRAARDARVPRARRLGSRRAGPGRQPGQAPHRRSDQRRRSADLPVHQRAPPGARGRSDHRPVQLAEGPARGRAVGRPRSLRPGARSIRSRRLSHQPPRGRRRDDRDGPVVLDARGRRAPPAAMASSGRPGSPPTAPTSSPACTGDHPSRTPVPRRRAGSRWGSRSGTPAPAPTRGRSTWVPAAVR